VECGARREPGARGPRARAHTGKEGVATTAVTMEKSRNIGIAAGIAAFFSALCMLADLLLYENESIFSPKKR
jgi:hypothetical protein